jgi:copper chaperone CopZ
VLTFLRYVGVQTVDIDLATQKVVVTGTASEESVLAALVKSGKPYKRVVS